MISPLAAIPLTSPDRLGGASEVVVVAVGAVLILVVLGDLISTTLSGGGRFGIYSGPMCRGIWRVLRGVARKLPSGKDAVLNAAGPLMLLVVPAGWVLLPIAGFALMILPGLDGGFVAAGGEPIPAESRHWITSTYISGYAFTTLGAGPFTPQGNLYRLLFVAESAIGFATFTLAITYLLSVLSALRRRNSFARQVHHLTGGTDDALVLLKSVAGDVGLRREVLLELSRGLHDVHESHVAYPILHYFRHGEPHFMMSTQADVAADLVSLARAVEPDANEWHRSADAVVAYKAATSLLGDLAPRFLGTSMTTAPPINETRIARAVEILGGEARVAAVADRYWSATRDWRTQVAWFRHDMLFTEQANEPPT